MAGGRDQIEVDGLRIAYERAGDGPPLILLHGYVGDSGGTWHRQLEPAISGSQGVPAGAHGAGGRVGSRLRGHRRRLAPGADDRTLLHLHAGYSGDPVAGSKSSS